MATLSGNTNGSLKEVMQPPGKIMNSGMMINSIQTPHQSVTTRMPMSSQNYSLAQRSHNFEADMSTAAQRQGIFSPNTTTNASNHKPTFSLPTTKQVPQQQFVMDLSSKSQNRKVSQNPKPTNSQSIVNGTNSLNQKMVSMNAVAG